MALAPALSYPLRVPETQSSRVGGRGDGGGGKEGTVMTPSPVHEGEPTSEARSSPWACSPRARPGVSPFPSSSKRWARVEPAFPQDSGIGSQRPALWMLPKPFWSFSYSLRSPRKLEVKTTLYLDVTALSGGGAAAVPAGLGDAEGTAPCLSLLVLLPSGDGGWLRRGARLLCHSLGGTALSSPPQPDSEGCSLHLEGE